MPFDSKLSVQHVDGPGDDAKFFGEGAWETLAPLTYRSTLAGELTVPAGFLTDFASVPRLPLAYFLTAGTGHRAAVLHDWLCRTGQKRSWADAVFREALASTGVCAWRCWLMWAGVRIGFMADIVKKVVQFSRRQSQS